MSYSRFFRSTALAAGFVAPFIFLNAAANKAEKNKWENMQKKDPNLVTKEEFHLVPLVGGGYWKTTVDHEATRKKREEGERMKPR